MAPPGDIYSYAYSNFTNLSATDTAGNDFNVSSLGYVGYYLILLLNATVALILALLAIAALCCNNKVQSALAVFLVNQLVACIAVILAGGIMGITATSLTIIKASKGGEHGANNLPPLPLCQVAIWLYGFGSIGRMWSLVAFSIVVLVTVRYGQKVFKHVHMLIGVAGVWTISFLLNLRLTLPYPAYAVHFVDGVGCFPHFSIINKTISYPTVAIWTVFGGLLPWGISMAIPIFTLRYIRQNIVSQDSQCNKTIAKFALFLVVGNIVNFMGQALPGLIAFESKALGLLLVYALVSISVLPTPIIIIAFSKPIRDRAKTIACCLWLKSPKQSGATSAKHSCR